MQPRGVSAGIPIGETGVVFALDGTCITSKSGQLLRLIEAGAPVVVTNQTPPIGGVASTLRRVTTKFPSRTPDRVNLAAVWIETRS